MLARPDKLVLRQSAALYDGRHLLPAAHLAQFPFTSRLSLQPLVEYWRKEESLPTQLRAEVDSYLAQHPTLAQPIGDTAELNEHRKFLELLMLPLFPSAFARTEAAAALVPFEFRAFYSTPAFQRLFTQDGGVISGRVNLDLRTFTYGRIVSAYIHVLRTLYGVNIPFEYPVTFTVHDPDTGLDRHFKVVTDLTFVRIEHEGQLPPISEEMRRGLLTDFSDLGSWARVIPPSTFEFSGFSIIRAYDVTDEHVLSMLERDLIEEGSLSARTRLPDIEDRVRTLLRTAQLELGLSVIDKNDFYLLNDPSQPLVDIFFTRSVRYDISDLEKSVFQRCIDEGAIQVVEDLESRDDRSRIEDDLLRWGVRNIVAAPLYADDETVGVLYLWSPLPTSLGAINIMMLVDMLPIFAASVKRAREEMRNRVQDVIMGKYTAIHHSVEWRFRQAAMNFLKNHEHTSSREVEPIVFKGVYPLFAATDIRGSSSHRNEAVRHDLLDHLQIAEEVLNCASQDRPLAVFYHLLARIHRYASSLQRGLSSGDEAEVRDFVQADLEPILLHLDGISTRVDACLSRYREAIDPENGTLYVRTRAFDKSVRVVNETISEYLDSEQEKIQRLLPHYFEKHQTDGVAFSIYIGGSLLEDEHFDPINVSALRLWQLMVMCGIALRMDQIKLTLEDPLETTHLVIVQNAPINIRYRFDETRFDVDGPHHIRFEIMKQRVEKACIKGTKDRLTQPDRIAIVYSQEREADEYWKYIDYLHERGFVSSEVEDLQLDDLQGMKGLRALRVKVAAASIAELPEIDPAELFRSAESLAT